MTTEPFMWYFYRVASGSEHVRTPTHACLIRLKATPAKELLRAVRQPHSL